MLRCNKGANLLFKYGCEHNEHLDAWIRAGSNRAR